MAARDVSDDDLIRQWRDIESATARLRRRLDADLDAAGVPPQWYPALELLLSAEGHRLPMSTLARELTMTSGGFSKLADRMAADGLIDRRGTTDDRRVVHATLTEAGHELARAARNAYVRALRSRFGDGDRGGLADAAALLRRLAGGAGAEFTDKGKGADNTSAPEPSSPHVMRERDPALPDRRGRGHGSGSRNSSTPVAVTGPPRSGPDVPR